MRRFLRRCLFAIWPPCETLFARSQIRRGLPADDVQRFRAIEEELGEILGDAIGEDPCLEELRSVVEVEFKRKEAIEGKATSYLIGLSIAIGLVSAVPSLLGKDWELPSLFGLALAALYALAVLHFFVAAYHANAARQTGAFAVPRAEDVIALSQLSSGILRTRVIQVLSRVRFNIPALTEKANHLATTESMFKRGLLLLALGSICSLAGRLLGEVTDLW